MFSFIKTKGRDRGGIAVVIIQIISILFVIFVPNKSISLFVSCALIILFFTSFSYFLLYSVSSHNEATDKIILLSFIVVNVISLVILFGNIYRHIGLNDPSFGDSNSTSIYQGIYFSVVTWTTLGYGDITPTISARPVAAIEAIIGYIVMAFMISALIDTFK